MTEPKPEPVAWIVVREATKWAQQRGKIEPTRELQWSLSQYDKDTALECIPLYTLR